MNLFAFTFVWDHIGIFGAENSMSYREKPFVVGVGGGSGSGKTTFLALLTRQLGPNNCTCINLDHYYRTLAEQPRDAQGEVNFDLPECIDHEAFLTDFRQLCNGNEVFKKEYTFNQADKKPENIRLLPKPVLLVEGLFLFHFREIMDLLQLKVFLEAPDELRLIRRIARDGIERGYPENVVRYQWEYHVRPAFDSFIYPHLPECDLIIPHSRDNYVAVDVISTYINQKIEWKTVSV
ncbi:MAG: uridine kinase [Sphingomonadales bacterium]|nr:uridine kinase [Sphingomonadales bacterium]